MRVVPRRDKERRRPRAAEAAAEPPATDGRTLVDPGDAPPQPDPEPEEASEPEVEAASEPEPEPVPPAPEPPKRKPTRAERKAAKKADKAAKKAAKKGGPPPESAAAPVEPAPPVDPDTKRRARVSERQRRAAEVKRARASQNRVQETAFREHRSALVAMILTLGLLIAAVAVTGGLIAGSMRTRPVTLAAPLNVYPISSTLPGQCQAGTQGISSSSSTGPTCYQLTPGIAIRKVAELKIQKARTKGAYDVAVTLRKNDRKAFADLTRAMQGRDLALVVKNNLVTVSRVEMAITDGKIAITGPPNRAEADKLLHELRGK
ncbi:hypothetical protein J4573_30145 [Actinomadura barringtoniae]|uniref:SecDF P1 head subdomain domain-containing protein n=1 Tax=Actinomadura barringtoniae TaxID=1427535 RepID=A0A939PF29_9ACTN|nr:hypothetical protein [Actinomadura barringtoniae]MBO2451385.1 hypothetical protein [Actinomadura barringtoniae]